MRNRTKERAKDERQYNKRVKVWKKENPYCKACETLANHRGALLSYGHKKMIRRTADNHHIRGRNGALLLDERYWLPVCRECHNWIGLHGKLARELGFVEDVDYRNVTPA